MCIIFSGCASEEFSEPDQPRPYYEPLGVTSFLTMQESDYETLENSDESPPILRAVEQGELVVVEVDTDNIPQVADVLHSVRKRCGGFTAHAEVAAALVATEEPTPQASFGLPEILTLDQPAEVAAASALLVKENILGTIVDLGSFTNRYYRADTGQQAAEWVAKEWREMSESRSDITVRTIAHNFVQPSVEMRIEGTESPDELVVIGGHLDSISYTGRDRFSAIAPGADDNASGIAVLTEVARALIEADFRPRRTILVYGYAGEEAGLLGSDEIAKTAAASLAKVVGVLQLDMVNVKGPGVDFVLIEDYTDDKLTAFLADVIDMYLPDAVVGRDSCGYGCSDHASWHQAGFPAASPAESYFSAYNNTIHSANDTIGNSGDDAAQGYKFAQLATAFTIELAKGEIAAAGGDDNDGGNEPPDTISDGSGGDDSSVTGGCSAGGSPTSMLAICLLVALCFRRRRAA